MFERICIILLLNILFYLKTFRYKYVSDDLTAFQKKKTYTNKWIRIFDQLRGTTKYDLQQDHLITLFFHSLVCVFIYITFGQSDISFLASLLFAFNPVNNQGSVWMSGRGYVLSALFILMAISIPYLGPLFLAGAVYYNLGFVASIVVFASKHWWIGLTLPLLWYWRRKQFESNVVSKFKQETFGEDKKINIGKVIVTVKTFGYYLVHALFPIRTTFYHAFMQSMAGSQKDKAYKIDKYFYIGIICITSIFIYWFTHPWNMTSFALFWWCIFLGPFLNFFRMSQEIAERYAYAPSIGLMYVLATIINPYPILGAIFITMYATKMWFYMEAYRDDYYLCEYACFNSTDAWYAWHIRALKRWDTQSYREAAILWVMANLLSPKEFKVLVNLATVLKLNKQFAEAETYLKKAEENIPLGMETDSLKVISDHRKGECSILL